VDLVNSVVWDNGGGDFVTVDDTSTITARYTLSADPMDGEGNLSADPLFADPDHGDFHVRSTQGRYDPASGWVQDGEDSPTIDAGDPTSAFDLEPGPNGLRVNLGHTGNTAEASMGGPGGDPPATTPTTDGTPVADTGSSTTAGPDGDGPKGDDPGCGCTVAGRPTPLLVVAMALSARRRRSR
jgi:MYXO-CTERM domain-containing protein